MFYSSEILTSRKYGVATVWIVATLGQKSAFKRVNRKAIVDVDVRKACDTILSPEAPLALRLQSNLLYGVTRVYAQQCGYVLADAESAKDKMLAVFNRQAIDDWQRQGKGAEHRGKPEAMLLSEELDCDFTLLLDDAVESELRKMLDQDQSQLSPNGSHSWRKSSSEIEIAPLQVPSPMNSSPVFPNQQRGTYLGPDSTGSGGQELFPTFHEDDLGFVIDSEGNLIMRDVEDTTVHLGSPPSTPVQRNTFGVATPGMQAGDQHSRSSQAIVETGNYVLDGSHELTPPVRNDERDNSYRQTASTAGSQPTTTIETAVAPNRRARRAAPRVLPPDLATELRTRDLARWVAEYKSSMRADLCRRDARREALYSKVNAQHWVLGQGKQWLMDANGPLYVFSGDYWYKHALKNLRGQGERKGGGEQPGIDQYNVSFGTSALGTEMDRLRGLDETTMEVEVGREAPTPLIDRRGSSLLPWSQMHSSSVRSLGFGGRRGAASSISAGMRATRPGSRQGSRVGSYSPLQRRSTLAEPITLLSGGPEIQPFCCLEEFDGDVDMNTSQVEPPDAVHGMANGESLDFLAFVEAGMTRAQEEERRWLPDFNRASATQNAVYFATLLPTSETSCVVAAQAFMHVLSLATRSLLKVRQQHHFGNIVLTST